MNIERGKLRRKNRKEETQKEDFGRDLVMKDQLDMNKNTRRKEMLANLFISCYTL